MDRPPLIVTAVALVSFTVMGCGQSAATSLPAKSSPLASVQPSASASATVAAAPPQAPAEFTGRIVCGPPVSPDRGGVSESLKVGEDGLVLTRYRGGAWVQTVTMSDPRLEGALYHTYETDTYVPTGSEKGPEMFAATHRIENETGVWESRSIGGAFADGTSIGEGDRSEVWTGAGGYAGLVAIMEATPLESACAVDVRGVIFAGGPVPMPYVPN